VPEQAEDIYWLLVTPKEIVMAEIPRSSVSDEEPVMRLMDLETFRKKRLSRPVRDRLEVALELLRVPPI
jgi:hypothetical protein